MIDWNEFPPMPIIPSGQSTNTHLNKRSYAEVTKNDSRYNNTQPASIENNKLTLMRFLDEFKQTFNQLIQQNKQYSFEHANRIDKQAQIRHTSLRRALYK